MVTKLTDTPFQCPAGNATRAESIKPDSLRISLTAPPRQIRPTTANQRRWPGCVRRVPRTVIGFYPRLASEANESRWTSSYDGLRQGIFSHDGAGGDHCPVANGDARQNYAPRPDADVVANSYRGDSQRLQAAYESTDQCTLGCGAMSGRTHWSA